MKRSKEAELIFAAYLYLLRCWSEEDFDALIAVGLGRADLELLQALYLSDLDRLVDGLMPPLTLQLDRQRLQQILDHLRQQRQQDQTFRALLLRDAPFPMMHTLFGIDAHEYAHWRRVLEIPLHAGGRPPAPDEDLTARIWQGWKALLGDRDPLHVHPEEWMALHAQVQCSLRVLWTVVHPWYQDHDNPDGRASKTTPSPTES